MMLSPETVLIGLGTPLVLWFFFMALRCDRPTRQAIPRQPQTAVDSGDVMRLDDMIIEALRAIERFRCSPKHDTIRNTFERLDLGDIAVIDPHRRRPLHDLYATEIDMLGRVINLIDERLALRRDEAVLTMNPPCLSYRVINLHGLRVIMNSQLAEVQLKQAVLT